MQINDNKVKIEECAHRTWMSQLPAKVKRYFSANQDA